MVVARSTTFFPRPCRKSYPPSILILGDNALRAMKLKYFLKNNDCRVTRIDAGSGDLAAYKQEYFDVIILNIDHPQINGFQIRRKLETMPELANLPVVVLAACHSRAAISGLETGPIYYLSPETLTEAKLLRVIEQIRYMTDRYV